MVLRALSKSVADTMGGVVLSVLVCVPATAGTIWLPGGGGISNVPTSSIEERKFEQVVRQQYDFSCGSAALATLLTFHYDDPTDETAAFSFMYEHGDQERIAREGFSLLDMKTYLENDGYQADGYQADLDTLVEAGIPAIALINYRGYQHFVVVKGVRDDRVLIGDPALGARLVSVSEFESMWDNEVLFIIRNKPEVGRRNFNGNSQWAGTARAPLGAALNEEGLASLTIKLPRIGDF